MTAGLSVARYGVGCGLLLTTFGPLVAGAVRWRRRLAPTADPPTARMIELTLVFAASGAVAELLGVLGAFRPAPVLVGCLVVGVVASLIARTPPGRSNTVALTPLAAVAGLAIVVATTRWSAGTLASLSQGILDSDSQTYHLPDAARFVQDASLTHLNFATVDDAVPYHPLNSEVLHAYGMLAFGRDLVSPLLNLLWSMATMVAAWVVGDHWKRGSVAALAVAALLSTRIMWETQGGSARSDIAALCMLLIAVALALRASAKRVPVWFAAVAAGLAAGSKLTVLVPVAALTIVVLASSGSFGLRPLRLGAQWIGSMAVAGGFWYARNLVAVGNPVPSVGLRVGDIGPPRLPMRLVDRYGFSVADYLLDGKVWRSFFVPGLSDAFGPLWPLIVLGPLVTGIVAIVRGRSWLIRGLGVTVVISFVAYLVTPTTALGERGEPVLFGANLRYLAPALIVGLVLMPVWASSRNLGWAAAAVSLAVVIATLPYGWQGNVLAAGVAGVVATAVVAVMLHGAPPLQRTTRAAAAIALIGIVAAAGLFVQGEYLRRRFATDAYRSAPNRAAFAWAQSVDGATIGTSGFFLNYPLYGAELTNRVRYIGAHEPDGAFVDARTCSTWKDLVNRGRFDYVVTMPPFPGFPEPPMASWARSDDAVVDILRSGRESVFAVRGRMDPRSCP